MITYGTILEWNWSPKTSRMPNQVEGGAEIQKSLAYMGFEENDVMIGNRFCFLEVVPMVELRFVFTEIVRKKKRKCYGLVSSRILML
jgi:3-isopropylmalate/(R)-2-methylmalate dehydratase large subunit